MSANERMLREKVGFSLLAVGASTAAVAVAAIANSLPDAKGLASNVTALLALLLATTGVGA